MTLLSELLNGFTQYTDISKELQLELNHIMAESAEFRDMIVNRVRGLDNNQKIRIIDKHQRVVKPLITNLQDAIRYLKRRYGV